MSRAKPTVPVHVRLDLETHEQRERLQEALQCQMPELIRRALSALETSLKNDRAPKAA